MLNSINQDAFTLFNQGGNLIPYEYTGYKNEILASKSTAWLGTTLNNSPIYDVKGPDAAVFLTSVCINSFLKMKPVRQGIFPPAGRTKIVGNSRAGFSERSA
jgi:glycine cleavage system aminomethyltransferase T